MSKATPKITHHCPATPSHLNQGFYRPVLDYQVETENDTLRLNTGEFSCRINYCPLCGYKASNQMEFK